MDIGKKIRNLRLQNNIKQNDLACIIGVSKSTMSNYERNYSTPDPDILVKLADYFNVSIDYLFDYEDNNIKTELANESSSYTKTNAVVLRKDERNVLYYYNRLSDEHKDYIKGRMIQLYFNQTESLKEDDTDK